MTIIAFPPFVVIVEGEVWDNMSETSRSTLEPFVISEPARVIPPSLTRCMLPVPVVSTSPTIVRLPVLASRRFPLDEIETPPPATACTLNAPATVKTIDPFGENSPPSVAETSVSERSGFATKARKVEVSTKTELRAEIATGPSDAVAASRVTSTTSALEAEANDPIAPAARKCRFSATKFADVPACDRRIDPAAEIKRTEPPSVRINPSPILPCEETSTLPPSASIDTPGSITTAPATAVIETSPPPDWMLESTKTDPPVHKLRSPPANWIGA